ncbi:MAG: AAA family ATPase [Chloroflexi bacterium]|nr:AAA family ATPase [Chloroflexota bacterium]
MRTLSELLASARLVTLTGPGGVGKTRLALAVAARLADRYADGVAFVDLAPLRDERLVAATIAWSLGLRESGGRSAHELIREHLRDQQRLVVLDNFEHLLGAAPMVAGLLAGCPRLAVLATSRAALHVRGERRVAIEPLATPAAGARRSVAELAAYPAVRLFVEHAQVVAPFELDASNAEAIAAICRRLDGLPLAIELAAARAPLLSPEGLLRRLEGPLPVLTGGPRDLPDRQQTLRATLDWSYDLLRPAEQALFRRLAVFAGGWSVAAAEAVCTGGEVAAQYVFDHLAALVDRSLLQVRRPEEDDDEPRFGMLETIREYADQCLELSREAAQVRARHRDWFLALAERAPTDLAGPEEAAWHARLDREAGNLQRALEWDAEPTADAEPQLRLATALARLRRIQGRFPEARRYLETVLRRGTGASAIRAQAQAALGHLMLLQGEVDGAERLGAEAVETARTVGDAATLAHCLRLLGTALAQRQRNARRARAILEDALGVARTAGDPLRLASALMQLGLVVAPDDQAAGEQLLDEAIAVGRSAGDRPATALALGHRAAIALARGAATTARALADEARLASEAVGYRDGVVLGLWVRAADARAQGEYLAAREQYQAAIRLAWDEGHICSVCALLDHYAGLEAERGQVERAALLAGALDAACAARDIDLFRIWTMWWAAEPSATRARVRAGEPVLVAAWQAGRALSLAQAVHQVLEDTPPSDEARHRGPAEGD